MRELDGAPVLAMSAAGMLAMKEQYPHLRNGGPWRHKDIDDIQVLRRLAAEAWRVALTAWAAGDGGVLAGPPQRKRVKPGNASPCRR